MKKNNKGFTLVELLAVIVILAVIMIIATQQVNDLIKKSRMSSFNDSVGVAVKTAKIFIADENLTQARLRNGMDYSTNEYEIYLAQLINYFNKIYGIDEIEWLKKRRYMVYILKIDNSYTSNNKELF